MTETEELEQLTEDFTNDDTVEVLGTPYMCATCHHRPLGYTPSMRVWQCMDCSYEYETRDDVILGMQMRETKLQFQAKAVLEGERKCLNCGVPVATWVNGKLTLYKAFGHTVNKRGQPLEYYCNFCPSQEDTP